MTDHYLVYEDCPPGPLYKILFLVNTSLVLVALAHGESLFQRNLSIFRCG